MQDPRLQPLADQAQHAPVPDPVLQEPQQSRRLGLRFTCLNDAFTFTREGSREAKRMLVQALELDPGSATLSRCSPFAISKMRSSGSAKTENSH